LESSIEQKTRYEEIIKETSRQLKICNACRYCEGFCPVWDAIEYRTEFNHVDIGYLSNLCHDCGQCFDVCPFVPPHEFSLDIPAALSEVRSYTYEEYSTPKVASRFFKNQFSLLAVTIGISILSVFGIYYFTGNPTRIISPITGPGSFYVVLPNTVIDTAGILLATFVIAVWLLSGVKFMRATSNHKRIKFSDFFSALRESFAETWFKGGGAGCNYPERNSRGNRIRLYVHAFVFYGFILDLLSTISAFIEQEFGHILPPYAIISIPVILGLTGGILIITGVVFFFYYDLRANGSKNNKMKIMDKTFLVTLLLTALTGILLLSLRNTVFMGSLLVIHVSFVGVLFVTAPYGKFIHFVYRYLSMIRYHQEKRAFEQRNGT
jgi:citrate/tricarballylate utilization protein